ncbi:MAG: hypothetical protein AB1671_26565 [Thermodesulfobacteriota bacterium]|jgi:hypothetical protein
MSQELATVENKEGAPLTAQEIKAQVQLIQEVMQAVMQEGYHYGVIPGTEKPTLLKPGAEKLTMTFRLAPMLHVESRELGDGHREYQVRCTLVHIPTGRIFGEGVGLCSTLESRYRYRYAERVCPHCGKPTIIKGRAEYGGGWLCFQRKGGCGAKFGEQDPAIVNQQAGRVENLDLADTYNTVLKMAKKRALIDATLTATAASDIFTQDLEDFTPEAADAAKSGAQAPQAAPAPTAKPAQPAATNGGHHRLNKGQLEIVQVAQRRAKVSDADFKAYLLATYHVTDPKEVKQKDLNRILEWLEQQHARHLEREERAAPQE